MAYKEKKQYVSPKLEIVNVQLCSIIAASGGKYVPFGNDNGSEQYTW